MTANVATKGGVSQDIATIVTIDTNEIETTSVCVKILSGSPYSGLIKVLLRCLEKNDLPD